MIIFHKDTASTGPATKIATATTSAILAKLTTATAQVSMSTNQITTAITTTVTTATETTTTAAPTKEELLSASCFPPNWPNFADKTLVKLNVLDRTKCLGICQRIPECLGFAAENRFCILKLSDNLENYKSATGIYKFLRQN